MLKVLSTLLMTCGVAQAEQIIFSQYDGKVTWRNTYVEVDNAKDWFKPIKGVTFTEARNMKSKPATAGSPAIAASPAISEVPWTTDKITRTFLVGNLNQAISEQIYYKASSSSTFYDKLTINTYNNNTNYSSYGVPAGTLSFSQAYNITDASASASNVVVNFSGKPMNTYHTTDGTAYAPATEARAAVDAIAAEPERIEDIAPARLIVQTPWDADVKEFIKDYMGS
jgi:hypothetical protein